MLKLELKSGLLCVRPCVKDATPTVLIKGEIIFHYPCVLGQSNQLELGVGIKLGKSQIPEILVIGTQYCGVTGRVVNYLSLRRKCNPFVTNPLQLPQRRSS